MKIIDTRDNTIISGVLVHTIPARATVCKDDMLRFYGMRPSDKNYDIMQQSMTYDRLVLRRGDGDSRSEPSYFIVPHYPFYEVQP